VRGSDIAKHVMQLFEIRTSEWMQILKRRTENVGTTLCHSPDHELSYAGTISMSGWAVRRECAYLHFSKYFCDIRKVALLSD
jgi:hypothetical protein